MKILISLTKLHTTTKLHQPPLNQRYQCQQLINQMSFPSFNSRRRILHLKTRSKHRVSRTTKARYGVSTVALCLTCHVLIAQANSPTSATRQPPSETIMIMLMLMIKPPPSISREATQSRRQQATTICKMVMQTAMKVTRLRTHLETC